MLDGWMVITAGGRKKARNGGRRRDAGWISFVFDQLHT